MSASLEAGRITPVRKIPRENWRYVEPPQTPGHPQILDNRRCYQWDPSLDRYVESPSLASDRHKY